MKIKACDFAFRCNAAWEDMRPLNAHGSRHCSDCNRAVQWCETEADLIAAVSRGDCVAVSPALVETDPLVPWAEGVSTEHIEPRPLFVGEVNPPALYAVSAPWRTLFSGSHAAFWNEHRYYFVPFVKADGRPPTQGDWAIIITALRTRGLQVIEASEGDKAPQLRVRGKSHASLMEVIEGLNRVGL